MPNMKLAPAATGPDLEHAAAQVSSGNPARPSARVAMTVVPAAAITLGLFVIMGSLIATDFVPAEAEVTREITAITPQEVETDVRRTAHRRAKPPEALDTPPPPPRLTATKSDIDLPTPQILGTAPTELVFETVQPFSTSPVAINERDVQPIRKPLATYPARALDRGLEGECAVSMDVDVRGRPYNIEAVCTDNLFRNAAVSAVKKAEFAPKIVRGQSAERRNVVYPIRFALEN